MKKGVVLGVCLLLAAGMVFAGGGGETGGQKKYLLKVGTVLTENDPTYKGMVVFAENTIRRTDGAVDVQIFASATLGADEDVLEQAKIGTNVGVVTEAGRLSAYIPEFGIFGAPYLIRSIDDIGKVLATSAYKGMADQFEKFGLKILSYNYFQGERHLFTKEPAAKPADLKGVRIRSMGSPVGMKTVEAMGANPVVLPWSEAYQSLQQNVVDGVEVHYSAAVGIKIQEVTKYLSKTGQFYLISGIVVSNEWYKSLPPDLQKIVSEECYKGGEAATKGVIDGDAAFEKQLTQGGIKIVDIDYNAFVQATAKVYDELGYGELKRKIDAELGR
ncbi:MAG: C4-dicarboxylate TRAP transporter substrate-binding protein [Spirochaetales bacterium]|jgi:tripartite ATP-independent transporter DctP family solute receptor|nr:C4-dicarboxylate TRAP transporter substrate-binding protein [Spirochaetales bacterium]